MKRVLVIGMSDNIGGTETFSHTYYNSMDRKELHFDFATVCDTVAFGDEYKKDGSKIFNLPNFLKHPVKYYHSLRKIIRENKPPLYDTTLCEKPISYNRKQSEIRTKGKSKDEIKQEFINLCRQLGFEPSLY